MSKTLGLDLGTNSIGWALVDENKEKNKLVDKGVLIFSEGVKKEKGQEKSRAAERTSKRSARRLNFRRKIRKYQTLLVLAKHKMCPLTEDEVKEWRKSNFKNYPTNPDFLNWLKTDDKINKNPYYFRNISSREKVSNYNLGRALYHIAQRRGFLSNRLDQSDKGIIEKHQPDIEVLINRFESIKEFKKEINDFYEPFEILNKKQKDLNAGENELKKLYNVFSRVVKEDLSIDELKQKLKDKLFKKENSGIVKRNIDDLNEAIKGANCETLGQYFWKLYIQDRNVLENKIRKNYTSRESHYLIEFEKICQVQNLDDINKLQKDANKRYNGIVKELYKAIFYQRPLKSQKGLVGKCSLESKRARCPISRPEFEEFRMFSFINTIKVKTSESEVFRFLTEEEKIKIEPKFYRKSKPTFTFDDIINELGKSSFYNYKNKTTVSGCPTISNLKGVFGKDWENTLFKNYTDKTIKNRKTKEVIGQKTKVDVVADIWHVLSTYSSEEKLKNFAKNKLKTTDDVAVKFSKINLKKDYSSLSLYAINKILPYLKSGLLYPHAVFMANLDKIVAQEKWNNKNEKAFIEAEVGKIIENHNEENKIIFVINSLLKNNFDSYSEEAKEILKNELHELLKKEFGRKKWEEKINKTILFSEAFYKFKIYAEKRKFLKIKRIDEKIIAFLKGENVNGEIYCEEDKLLKKIYHPSDIEKFKSVKIKDSVGNELIGLGTPEVGSIKNPMAMKALYQLKKLINTLIIEGQINEDTKINIELSRQLNDANKRKAIEKWQNHRKELYQTYADKIKELYPKENNGKTIETITDSDIEKFAYVLEQRVDGKIVNKEDILKYSLWEEQNHICLYTGKTINLSSFLGKSPDFDIEHTLPRSLSWDNSKMNKTLCENKFNRDGKGNKIPFELQVHDKILPRIAHWKTKYEALHNEIEKLRSQTRNATDKEQKDRLIQKRHYKKMEHDYWKGKYSRFVMEEIKGGFKNSQAIDIGIISKYARAYLKSVFKKVYALKGEMVAEYRKAWGVNITTLDENSRLVKNRGNHIHHCIDAVIIACMSKNKYDELAYAWGLEDKGSFNNAKEKLEREKPWKTFTKDVLNLEKEVCIVHHTKDVLPIQTKRKFRIRGKIQKNKNEEIIYLQGDTVRGSLHLDTFYGAIAKGKNGEIKKDINAKIRPNFVVRKELKNLKKSDVANIVDSCIRKIVEKAEKDKLIIFNKNGAKISEDGIWQNKEKEIPLYKVRVYTPTVKSPLKDFKKHAAPFLSKKEYKQQYNVVNDQNYCIAIYEGLNSQGKLKRNFEILNNIEAGNYFKKSNVNFRKQYSIAPDTDSKHNLPLKYVLKKGVMILMYDKNPDEIWKLTKKVKRLYKLVKFDAQGRLSFRPHSEAKKASELKEFYSVDFNNLNEQVRLQVSKLNILVENIDFKITTTGKIEKL